MKMTLIVRMILLILGILVSAWYAYLLRRGSRYDMMIENLPEKGFGDRELFSAGFALEETKAFAMNTPRGKKLIAQAGLLYPENGGKYAEYWARIFWARTLSAVVLLSAVFLIGAACAKDLHTQLMVLGAGLAAIILIYKSGVESMADTLQKRADDCLYEFSNMVSKLALLMNCSLTLKDSWYMVAQSGKGEIYRLMRGACDEMNNGLDITQALYNFGVRSSSQEIRKFANVLNQSIARGGSDVTEFIRNEASELGGQKRQILLRRGDEAAMKLLMPTALVLAGVMLVILGSAFSGLDSSF